MLLLAHFWSPPTPALRELSGFLAAKCSTAFSAEQMSMLENCRTISTNTPARHSWERGITSSEKRKTRKSCRRENQNSNLKDAR